MEFNDLLKIHLSQEDIDQLNEVIRGNDPHRVRNRAQAILLLFLDHRTYRDVASIFRRHVNTIRHWAERWVRLGVDGLYDLSGRGNKPIFSKEEEKIIISYLKKEPRSIRKVAAMVEEITGKKAGLETYRRMIKKQGKSWKRERKIPNGKPSQDEYEKAKEEIEELKPLSKDGELDRVYFDAAGFTLQPYVPYAWQDIGRKGTIGIPSSHSERINILGFMNPNPELPELISFEHTGKVTGEVIVDVMNDFCDNLINPTVVLLDNASVHKCKIVSEQIEKWEKKGMTLYFIPSYSPQLNLIEILWRKIKYEWITYHAYTGLSKLKKELGEILDSFGSKYNISFS